MRKIAAGLLAAALIVAHPTAARAGGLAFWGYWRATAGTWTFAETGPAQAHPKNGTVEGWRFAKAKGDSGVPPRERPSFTDICHGAGAPPAGKKRVAVVIDYGEPADAPQGRRPPAAKRYCATVAENATGSDVLAAAGRAQADKSGLICAIDGFGPCGGPAAAKTPPRGPGGTASPPVASEPDGGDGGSTGLYAGIGLIVVLAAVGGVVAVRRRARG